MSHSDARVATQARNPLGPGTELQNLLFRSGGNVIC